MSPSSSSPSSSVSNNNNDSSIVLKCLAGGIGCGISGFVTNPMDVIKIKNQQYGGEHFRTFRGTARTLWNEQGWRGFFKGAASSVLREMTYSSLRMGLYEPIKDGLTDMTANTTTTIYPTSTPETASSSSPSSSVWIKPLDLQYSILSL
jgi:hypothetical protein